MNDATTLDVQAGDGIQVWKLRHAPVNAIGPVTLDALHDQLSVAIADESVAAVVLTSGLKVFSAGADATWMRQTAEEQGPEALLETFIATMDTFRALSLRIRRSPLLVIAALNGHTLAGGLELAAACDLRFAADNEQIKIGVPEMALFGQLPSGGGGVQFLARQMGQSRALDFILDAGPITPGRALQLGIVDRLYEPDELLGQTISYATVAAKRAGRRGISAAKRAVFTGAELSLPDGLEFDRAVHWDSVRRGDFAGTVDAFTARFAQEPGQ
jgi:enoyl-CoA hydratase